MYLCTYIWIIFLFAIIPCQQKYIALDYSEYLVQKRKTAYETKDFSGKIIVKYRNGKNRSEIPYYITVLKGGVTYNPLTTTYFINDKAVDLSSRAFRLRNEFEYPIQIRNITFPQDAHLYFKIETLVPKVLRPSEETNIFNIKLKSNIRLSDLQLHSHIILKTNISDVMVPLLSYNGKLKVVSAIAGSFPGSLVFPLLFRKRSKFGQFLRW